MGNLNDEKIQKVLARVGLGSRRQIEHMVLSKRILINNKLAKIGDRITPSCQVKLDGNIVDISHRPETDKILIYNKPLGEICTRYDPEGRANVFDNLPSLPDRKRWVMVGRLDINSQGLLLFTTDGDYANRLMHPSFKIARRYKVRAHGSITQAQILKLTRGVELEDGIAKFDKIKLVRSLGNNSWYDISISSGKNRIIRRLMESQNLSVNTLIRVSYGDYVLPMDLKKSQHQYVKFLDL
ncbi:MAG: pseudouridine synthase [Legionellales bacterium]|jgi:23S rRNA pseudouridine2605 synthase|nr:pseudouridine synthase [Legionellales bacterium]